MKKIISVILVSALITLMLAFGVSAEATTLLPDDDYWASTDQGGCSCNITFENGVAVVSGSLNGTWPCITNYFDPSACFGADINTYALHYDFKVASGNTNINFYFSQNLDDMDNGFAFTLSNTSLGAVNYDSGSGDLGAGTYSGYIPLKDFVGATTFLNNNSFDATFIDEDNKIYFTGVNIYSVNGAVIEIYALELIPVIEIPDEPEISEEESIDESEEESVPAESSMEDIESTESEQKDASAQESTESAESTESTAPAANENGSLIIWIIIAIVAIAAIAVVIVLVIKKKK